MVHSQIWAVRAQQSFEIHRSKLDLHLLRTLYLSFNSASYSGLQSVKCEFLFKELACGIKEGEWITRALNGYWLIIKHTTILIILEWGKLHIVLSCD